MIWLVAAAWADGECRAWGQPVERDTLRGHVEVSGIAAARVDEGTLFFHEDDGGPPPLFRYSVGADLTWDVEIEGVDWEDIAVASCPSMIDACACVCLGDIGDNLANRPTIQVVWFAERAAAADVEPTAWAFTWPDHPRDAEAMLVDDIGNIYIIAKDGSAVGVASGPGPLALLSGPDVDGDKRILAGSASPNGRRVVLRTDAHLWLYTGTDVANALASKPVSLPAPDDERQEAVAFSADGRSVWLTGEGTDPILWELRCAQFEEDADSDLIRECLDARVETPCGCSGSQASAAPLLLLALIGARRARG